MSSLIEKIPVEILQYIAFLSVAHDRLGPPSGVLDLLLTSQHFHQALNPTSAPQWYAWLFAALFDAGAARRRLPFEIMTSSCLTEELRCRFETLFRIKGGFKSNVDHTADLWTIYLMLLEDDGTNLSRLRAVGTVSFLVDFVRTRIRDCTAEARDDPGMIPQKSLALWSLWYMTTQLAVEEESEDDRAEMIVTLLPLVVDAFSRSVPSSVDLRTDAQSTVSSVSTKYTATLYSHELNLVAPDPFPAAILLTLARWCSLKMEVPEHFADTHAIAIATGRHGPTKADYYAIEAHFASLFVVRDSEHRGNERGIRQRPQSMRNDGDFARLFQRNSYPDVNATTLAFDTIYKPGMLTGLFEGHYLLYDHTPYRDYLGTPFVPAMARQYVNCGAPLRRAMQCRLSEHYPVGRAADVIGDSDAEIPSSAWWSALKAEIARGGSLLKEFNPTDTSKRRSPNTKYMILIGQTERDHGLAWGSFKFIGRVRVADGLIILKRLPSSPQEDNLGEWIFRGYLYSGKTLIGTVQNTIPEQRLHEPLRAIFVLWKQDD